MILEAWHTHNIKPIQDALSENPKNTLEENLATLNDFIHGSGSYGYDWAEPYGLEVSKKYSEETFKQLLDELKQTISLPDSAVYITSLDSVPEGLALKLAREVGGCGADYRQSELTFGLVRGYEVLGFALGEPFNNSHISISGMYMHEKHRRRGYMKLMLDCFMNEAKRQNLSGISSGNLSIGGEVAFRALHAHYERTGKYRTEVDIHYDDSKVSGAVNFTEE